MSPVRHTISAPALSFSLEEEMETIRAQLGSASERVARTLVKDGPLRVTLVGLNADGMLKPHKADGPITVHVIEGEIEFEAEGKTWALPKGALLALDGGITHSVSTKEGGIFLLTVVAVPRGTGSADVGTNQAGG
jgi:quercetin dioxygenase-like cupin family protein